MSTRRTLSVAGLILIVAAVGALPAVAQLLTYGLGRAPTTEEVRAWDLTIPPDGQGLPPGSGTAARGKAVYAEKCAACHGPEGKDPKYRPLAGGRGTLNTDTPLWTIGSFWPYATTVWSYINRAQPHDQPGSLAADEVYAVTAYLLYLNGIIGENDVLDAQTLPQVKMPNRHGFVPDPRLDVAKPSRERKR